MLLSENVNQQLQLRRSHYGYTYSKVRRVWYLVNKICPKCKMARPMATANWTRFSNLDRCTSVSSRVLASPSNKYAMSLDFLGHYNAAIHTLYLFYDTAAQWADIFLYNHRHRQRQTKIKLLFNHWSHKVFANEFIKLMMLKASLFIFIRSVMLTLKNREICAI